MNFNDFPDLPAVVDRIDILVLDAKFVDRKESREMLKEAQSLADAYEKHCGKTNLFKKFI